MSSAFRWFLPELLASPEMRAARRDRAFLVLDELLEGVLFSNAAGEAAFGALPGGTPARLLLRQIRSSARSLRAGNTVPLLVRSPAARNGGLLAAAATRFALDGSAAVLLATRDAAATASEDPQRILSLLDPTGDGTAAVLAANGTLVAGNLREDPEASLRDEIAAFVAADASSATAAGGDVRLFRIEDDLILAAIRDRRADDAQPNGEGARSREPESAPAAPPPISIAAMVGRWQHRRSNDEIVASASQDRPADDGSEQGPASLTDEPTAAPDESRQPVERESAVTLPDIGRDDADAMEPAVSTDEEAPPEQDGGLTPSSDEPGLGVDPGIPLDGGEAAPDEAPDTGEKAAAAFVPHLDVPPVRFVWQIDAEGRFRSLSPEFADVVGPRAAAVVGRAFREVAADFGFDENGAIQRLLDRRDTWSGRTVLWPVEGTDRRVPIDLAALPTYSRDRSFDGFRGFGIVRSADHEPDEAARGLHLAAPRLHLADVPAANVEAPPIPAPKRPLIKTFEADLPGVSFGRRQAPPQPPAAEQDGTDGIVPFAERRRSSDSTLSEAEEAAFREIGAKLGHQRSEAETPGALRFESLGPVTTEPDDDAARVAPASETDSIDLSAVETETGTGEDAGGKVELEDGILPLADIEPLLAVLPLPILIGSGDALVFANRAFAEFSGYDSIEALQAAGGLETLFAGRAAEAADAAMEIRRASGESVDAGVRMQRIAFAGRSSLLMTFERSSRETDVAASGSDDLRREVGELQAVLDIATDGVVILDPEGTIRAANGSAEALFGMTASEFKGRPLADLFAHESRKTVVAYMETLQDKGLAGIMNDGREVIGRVAQGGFVPLFITVGRVPEERGWCVVIRDMSHWKRIEEELVNAKRAAEAASLHKSRFLANISHELRTPLNAIIGFADVMASECFGPIGNERYVEYLGDIKRSGHHVLDLVNDLLDISKIEAGRMELNFEAVSLNEVLAEVVATMQPQANRERVIVRSNLPASVPPVVADRRTIRQIALNLLSNSVRFTPAGGQIIASTIHTAEGDVLMRVRDSGIGMSPSEIDIAMTPFQQVHKPNGERGTGTGLGLPLTKAMAEANRASFTIRSAPGEGTLVEIGFPAQRVLAD